MPRRAVAPSEQAAQRLQAIFNRKVALDRECEEIADELAVAAVEVSENEGASRAEIAKVLGVGTSTVHGWIVRGRQVLGR